MLVSPAAAAGGWVLLGVDPAELEAQLKWQCQYMPVLRRLSTRNVVLADQLKTSA